MGVLDRVFGLALVFDLVYQESNFSLMIGNKVLIYLTLRFLFQSVLIGEKRVTETRNNIWRGNPECNVLKTAARGVAVGRQ
jgi:hypothetical protein